MRELTNETLRVAVFFGSFFFVKGRCMGCKKLLFAGKCYVRKKIGNIQHFMLYLKYRSQFPIDFVFIPTWFKSSMCPWMFPKNLFCFLFVSGKKPSHLMREGKKKSKLYILWNFIQYIFYTKPKYYMNCISKFVIHLPPGTRFRCIFHV